MNFPPVNHGARGNITLLQMEDVVNPDLWEPQTLIVVVIFGLVCILHLTAFLYTICLQSYVNAGAHTFPYPDCYRRQVKERSMFYGFVSPSVIDHKETQQKERTPMVIDM